MRPTHARKYFRKYLFKATVLSAHSAQNAHTPHATLNVFGKRSYASLSIDGSNGSLKCTTISKHNVHIICIRVGVEFNCVSNSNYKNH